jgi:hypothetical protein
VDLAADGIAGLRGFVERLNLVDRRFRDAALFDVSLNWSEEVATACAFDLFPDWIMLSLTIGSGGRAGSPSKELLANVAKAWRTASRSATQRRS